jgi:hypothetical protein
VTKAELDQLLVEIADAASRFLASPFPYADCRKVLKMTNVAFPGLIPDLDLYFGDVFAHAAGLRRILRWSHERLAESERRFAIPFFEKHPEYLLLRGLITDDLAPALNQRLEGAEQMRLMLLRLFGELRARPLSASSASGAR